MVVTFNTKLDVYAKTGHYAEALRVLDQLEQPGFLFLLGADQFR